MDELPAMDDIIENAPRPLDSRPLGRPWVIVIAAVATIVAAGWLALDRLTASQPRTAPTPVRSTERPAPTPRETIPAVVFEKAVGSFEHRPGFVTATSVEVTPAQAGQPMMSTDESVLPGHYVVDLLCVGRGSVLVSVGDPVSVESFAAASARVPCGGGSNRKATLEVRTKGQFAIKYIADDDTLGAFAWAVSRI